MEYDTVPTRQTITKARERLGAAEASVEILRSIVADADSVAAGIARPWLHECERSVFCRRLELEALLRARREASPRPHFLQK